MNQIVALKPFCTPWTNTKRKTSEKRKIKIQTKLRVT